MAKTTKKAETTETVVEPEVKVQKLPSYLQKVLDEVPQGGDNGTVYAGDYGWVCEYPDGTKELLQELTGLAGTLKRYGRDKFGRPFEQGEVISTNITIETLNLLGDDDLLMLAEPLGITTSVRANLIAELAEKLKIK